MSANGPRKTAIFEQGKPNDGPTITYSPILVLLFLTLTSVQNEPAYILQINV